MKIALGADHAGFSLKEHLKKVLESEGHEVLDMGAQELNAEDDYPDFVVLVARAVAGGSAERGVVIGSSGQGEAIAANRIKGVRAMVYYGYRSPLEWTTKVGAPGDIIAASREDNDSNILSIGASFVTAEEADDAVRLWLSKPFTNEERHVRRIAKLDSLA